ncbi:transcriptional regulator [Spirochaetia bacterium]|nr:transcriptional regulator [Spirochaetia bacterium]
MGFKENLKSELVYRGMLVKELAALSGVSRHTLDNYLNIRGHIPSVDIAVKIAQVLGVSVEYLVTGQEKASLSPDTRALIRTIEQLDENDRKMLYGIAQLFKTSRKGRG